jgi:hypothetical protein
MFKIKLNIIYSMDTSKIKWGTAIINLVKNNIIRNI